MLKARRLIIGLATLGLVLPAAAQFEGPAPLSWRWAQPSRVAPAGSPVVIGNTVYAAVGQRIYALDKETGNRKWQFPLVEPINGYFGSGVITAEGLIIAAADNKNIYAVDPNTGELKWQFASLVSVIGQPVVVGKWLVFATSDNSLNALDVVTGETAWDNPVKVYDGILGSIAAQGSNVLYFTNSYELRAFNVTTKKQSWAQRFSVVTPDAVPIVYGDRIYVGTGQYVASVLAATGRGGRNGMVGDELAYGPAVSAEGALAVTREGKAVVLDASLRPTKIVVDLGSSPIVRPTAVGRMFVVATANGALNLIDPRSGTLVWSYTIRPMAGTVAATSGSSRPGSNTAPPPIVSIQASGPAVLSGNTLLVLARDGSMLAFDRDTGVDQTAPAARMVWPNSGDIVNGQTLELIFKLEDEATGVNEKSISVSINGAKVEHEYTREGFVIVRISPLGKNKSLRNGRATIVLSAADWMGNAETKSFALMIDNTLPPTKRPSGGEGPAGGGGNKGGGPSLGGGG